jgi:arylsulfatase A-like enzyme
MKEYLTDRLGREGVEFVERHKDEPFFLYLAFHAPHTPIQTIDKYYDRFPNIENDTLRIYSAMISAVDDWVGAILKELRSHGLEENTLVIFTSDNGAASGSDIDGARNKPFIGHKRNLYEGGIHIPYVMQWEDRIGPGQTCRAPVSSMDIFPTAIASGGESDLAQYNLDGVNLLPYLTGERGGDPHKYLVWRSGPNAAVDKGNWKLILSPNNITRLYNLDTDPAESQDLSKMQKPLVEEMKQVFENWKKDKAPARKSSRKVKTQFNGDVINWHI